MSIFGKIDTNKERTQDTVGGFKLLDTDIYRMTIKAMYAGKYDSGAQFLGFIATDKDGREYKQNLLVTNKKGDNFYVDKKTNKERLFTSFVVADDLCLLTTGKHIDELDTEDRVLKLYSNGKQEDTTVPCLVDAHGKEVALAITRTKKNKQEKDSAGNYVDTAEEVEENDIAYVFHADTMLSANEYAADKEVGEFHEKWLESNKGKVRNRYKAVTGGGTAARPQRSSAPTGDAPARKKLF